MAVLAPFLMMLEVVTDLMHPLLIRHIIDQGVLPSNPGVVLRTSLWMLVLLAIGMICGAACGFFATRASLGMGADLRAALFRKVQTLSFGNLDRLSTGGLMTRLTSDVSQIQEMVMIMLRGMVRMPLLLVGSLVMAFGTSPQLGLIFLVLLPVLVAILVVIVRKTFPLYRQVQRKLDRLNGVLQENLAGVRLVKAFARSDHESERFSAANNALRLQNTAAVRMSARTMPVMMLMLNLGIVTALWLGGRHVYNGDMQVGQVIAFINYLLQALMALMMVSMQIIQVSRAQASARRVVELLETRPSLKKTETPEIPGDQPGRIVFENVSFSYSGSEHDPVLKNISFTVEPGQTVAILGSTGSGKSSLVQLIPRFYDVTEGRVTLDGIDVRRIPEEELRRRVGIALQEAVLFRSSIRDNIRYGRPGAPEEEVLAAARWAQADEFIGRLPEGYDTIVGQRGVNLSGGQKQRLAIARALLPRPRVLILDDSTSAVDVGTEALIQKALSENREGQTRLIVAQRISAVLQADKILVLDDGGLVAEGTHEELLRSSLIYREIYESQMQNGVLVHHGD